MVGDPLGGAAAARRQWPLTVGERRIVPARLRVS
jgi:hypothetical protein